MIRHFLAGLCLLASCFALEAALLLSAYERGKRKGRSDAEGWIVRFEQEVYEEREKVWREEG